MSGISLTASMRSNLLSLQNISGQVSSTQNKLATGNKVNSAIDNPSSYYTARSLNNRADDLNALLDSMGQAVSTIKAATTALEAAAGFLEQASAVATQALETAKIPSKSYFEEKVGENGAVVTTAQELKDAIAAGKETICVYGKIDLGDISTTGGLTLKENQKLVGVGYFGNYDTDTNKFSSISATANAASKNLIDITKDGCVVSDLSLSHATENSSVLLNAINIDGCGEDKQYSTTLKNLDIITGGPEVSGSKPSIRISNRSNTNFEGKIFISASGFYADGVLSSSSSVNIQDSSQIFIKINGNGTGISLNSTIFNVGVKANLNIQTTTSAGNGMQLLNNSLFTSDSKGNVNIKSLGGGIKIYDSSMDINFDTIFNLEAKTSGVYISNGFFNINKNSQVNIQSSFVVGITTTNGGCCNIFGNLTINSKNQGFINNSSSNITIMSTAQIYISGTNTCFANNRDTGQGPNILGIAAGAKLAFEKDGKTDWYEVKEDYEDKNTSTTTDNNITAANANDKLNLESTSAWELPEKVEVDFAEGGSNDDTAKQDLADAGKNYQEIINQYDALINDSMYKGINLLQNDKLTVKFNETNTADLSVQGKDMSSQALGFKTFDWQTQADIADSLAEIANALKSIRNYSAELGNNYSIITTRQDFTESLINVLTEGADKLTLADMNEESANMLALQTRQQLAINSLSLASQASQSILKLF